MPTCNCIYISTCLRGGGDGDLVLGGVELINGSNENTGATYLTVPLSMLFMVLYIWIENLGFSRFSLGGGASFLFFSPLAATSGRYGNSAYATLRVLKFHNLTTTDSSQTTSSCTDTKLPSAVTGDRAMFSISTLYLILRVGFKEGELVLG